MDFFAESAKEFKGGVVGLRLVLVAKTDPLNTPSAMPELVAPFNTRCGASEKAFTLNFLSEKPSPFGLYAECHGHLAEKGLDHFIVSLQRKPNSAPPAKMSEVSNKLGGYPKGFLKILSLFREQKIKWRASFGVAVNDDKKWPLKFKRNKLAGSIDGFKLEHESKHFEIESTETEVDFTFMPNQKPYIVRIESEIDSMLNDACFQPICERLWEIVKPLFIKK